MSNTLPTIGDNRTGTARAKKLAQEMIDASRQQPISGDESALFRMRGEYEPSSGSLGSVPPPASAKQLGKTVLQKLKGEEPTLFFDKLGERLAFERTGVRFYEALIGKIETFGTFAGGPSLEEAEDIRAEELVHFTMLNETIEQLGGDPTAVTPSADFTSVVSKGIGDALSDPRTNLAQALEALLIAELADEESWTALVELTARSGEDELARRFESAAAAEALHVQKLRKWVAAAQGRA
jgi:rubrerythrin